jgi:death-on-curing protein
MYPEFLDQAAVLAVRISRNHPLLDGNKRLAWGCLIMFCVLNGPHLHVPTEEAVAAMIGVAAGELDEAGFSKWLAVWVDRPENRGAKIQGGGLG